MKKTRSALAALAAIWATSEVAIASVEPAVPEPGILGLLVAGGIVGVIITIRKRRK